MAVDACAPGMHSLDYVAGPGYWTSCVVCGHRWSTREATDRVAVTLEAPDGERGVLIGPAGKVADLVRPEAVVDSTRFLEGLERAVAALPGAEASDGGDPATADLRDVARAALQKALREVESAQVCATTAAHMASNPGWRTTWAGPGDRWTQERLTKALKDLGQLADAVAGAGAAVHNLLELYREPEEQA